MQVIRKDRYVPLKRSFTHRVGLVLIVLVCLGWAAAENQNGPWQRIRRLTQSNHAFDLIKSKSQISTTPEPETKHINLKQYLVEQKENISSVLNFKSVWLQDDIANGATSSPSGNTEPNPIVIETGIKIKNSAGIKTKANTEASTTSWNDLKDTLQLIKAIKCEGFSFYGPPNGAPLAIPTDVLIYLLSITECSTMHISNVNELASKELNIGLSKPPARLNTPTTYLACTGCSVTALSTLVSSETVNFKLAQLDLVDLVGQNLNWIKQLQWDEEQVSISIRHKAIELTNEDNNPLDGQNKKEYRHPKTINLQVFQNIASAKKQVRFINLPAETNLVNIAPTDAANSPTPSPASEITLVVDHAIWEAFLVSQQRAPIVIDKLLFICSAKTRDSLDELKDRLRKRNNPRPEAQIKATRIDTSAICASEEDIHKLLVMTGNLGQVNFINMPKMLYNSTKKPQSYSIESVAKMFEEPSPPKTPSTDLPPRSIPILPEPTTPTTPASPVISTTPTTPAISTSPSLAEQTPQEGDTGAVQEVLNEIVDEIVDNQQAQFQTDQPPALPLTPRPIDLFGGRSHICVYNSILDDDQRKVIQNHSLYEVDDFDAEFTKDLYDGRIEVVSMTELFKEKKPMTIHKPMPRPTTPLLVDSQNDTSNLTQPPRPNKGIIERVRSFWQRLFKSTPAAPTPNPKEDSMPVDTKTPPGLIAVIKVLYEMDAEKMHPKLFRVSGTTSNVTDVLKRNIINNQPLTTEELEYMDPALLTSAITGYIREHHTALLDLTHWEMLRSLRDKVSRLVEDYQQQSNTSTQPLEIASQGPNPSEPRSDKSQLLLGGACPPKGPLSQMIEEVIGTYDKPSDELKDVVKQAIQTLDIHTIWIFKSLNKLIARIHDLNPVFIQGTKVSVCYYKNWPTACWGSITAPTIQEEILMSNQMHNIYFPFIICLLKETENIHIYQKPIRHIVSPFPAQPEPQSP
ncbi:hypothetical protein NEHOM01_2046 [Nematocida homosporus]|uniref:uncharacterized protein n=1 Tax=Nematocida homosporus TaxID=1912981 RepID=UPI00222062E5|nr:uncharacterized protein NEHOM01_2046 [Nematocida homosporus]KAI5187255.1 hypothetical protein NEHOM01_2046 [Nematocida homosporus]